MEINIKWNMCRVCLTEEQKAGISVEPMRHIFDEDNSLAKKIYECSGIMMKPNDNLPEKICKRCLTIIKYAVHFRKTCRASDTYLHSILQRTKSASSLFKQKQPTSENELEEISNDSISYENIESEITETCTLTVVEQFKPLQRQGIHLEKTTRKVCEDASSPETNSKKDHLIEQEIEENENIVEEIIDHPKSCANQISNTKHGSYTEKNIGNQDENAKSKTLHMNFFELSEDVDDDYNFEANQETDLNNYKENKLYYLKNNKQENILHAKVNHQHKEQEEIYEEEYENRHDSSITEEVDSQAEMLQNFDDNQGHASLTVLARADVDKDDIELEEENSKLSTETNEMQAEYIIDEYLIDDNSSDNIPKQNSNRKTNAECNRYAANNQQKQLDHTKIFAKNYSSKTSSQIHVWICDLCGNHFTNRILLNAHMKVHRQEKKHECELCFKRFITACNLQAHMRVHTGEKPFECQYCQRRFSDRSSNLRHERIHTNEKPFQCKECGKSFSLGTTLKKHLKVHTGERLYRCDICAKSFKLLHQLKAHKSTTLHKAIEQLVQQEQ